MTIWCKLSAQSRMEPNNGLNESCNRSKTSYTILNGPFFRASLVRRRPP